MKITAENLPLSFLDDFHDIEVDEVKQAVRDIVNVMYDDYSIDDVQAIFSTFPSLAYEIYSMSLYCSNDDDFRRDLDPLVEVVLYCASQLEEYRVRPLKRRR